MYKGQNRDKQSNNTSGYKGASYYKRDKKYGARIKQKNLGLLKTAKETSEAYEAAAKEDHGEYYYKNKK